MDRPEGCPEKVYELMTACELARLQAEARVGIRSPSTDVVLSFSLLRQAGGGTPRSVRRLPRRTRPLRPCSRSPASPTVGAALLRRPGLACVEPRMRSLTAGFCVCYRGGEGTGQEGQEGHAGFHPAGSAASHQDQNPPQERRQPPGRRESRWVAPSPCFLSFFSAWKIQQDVGLSRKSNPGCSRRQKNDGESFGIRSGAPVESPVWKND